MAHQLAPLTEKPESLTQIVYQALRDAIISKRLPPGERVSEASLARQLRVSKTPVREALLRLHAIGLVEADGGRGGRIVRPSAELLRHTYQVLGTLESRSGRLPHTSRWWAGSSSRRSLKASEPTHIYLSE